MLVTKRRLRILDFDIETRPLSYWIPERPTAEITAIASCWTDDLGSMEVTLLGKVEPVEMLTKFVARYNEADIVTGHYIRKFDLPMINGALLEYGYEPLSPKMTSDTVLDLTKKKDIPATQEYLSEILGVLIDKYHMTQVKWRKSNRLTKEGLVETEKRVSTDVIQHIMLRAEMLERRILKAPKVWTP